MLRLSLKLSYSICLNSRSNTFRYVSTNNLKEKWDLFSAVCIERRPVIIPELNEIEKSFQKYLDDVEFEKSMKSLHEIRHEQDLKVAEALKKGELSDVELDSMAKQTAQDFEDICNDELSKFKFAARITEADKKNDTKSLERKLDRHLVLVVEHILGKQKYFLLPQLIRQESETMRQTAERVLKEYCGDKLNAKIFGNAPVGFYKYRYPKNSNKETAGAKIFIYFARYFSGQITNKNNKYEWLDRVEMENKLPNDYFQNVQKFLIDEPHIENLKI